MNLRDKVVVITGASGGLGECLARALTKEGAVVTISSRNESKLRSLASEIGANFFVTDITSESQVKKLAESVVQNNDRIDIWINNAGIWMPHGPVIDLNTEKLHELFEVNVFGLIYGSKLALEQMKNQGSGVIVNIISTSGLEGRAGSSGYAATKFAASGFTKSLQLESRADNVLTIGVYPGGMKTHFFDAKKPENYSEYMDPAVVAEGIMSNLKQENPDEEQIIRRH